MPSDSLCQTIKKSHENIAHALKSAMRNYVKKLHGWLSKIPDSKTKRFCALVVSGGVGVMLVCWLGDLVVCFFGAANNNAYALIPLFSLPVFCFLWWFRTHDTRENIAKQQEQIDTALHQQKEGRVANSMKFLAGNNPLEIEIGVQQLIRLSEDDNRFDADIQLAFIRRLKYCPLTDEEKKRDARLTYAQHILWWLYVNNNAKVHDQLDLKHCDFSNQDFVTRKLHGVDIFRQFNLCDSHTWNVSRVNISNCATDLNTCFGKEQKTLTNYNERGGIDDPKACKENCARCCSCSKDLACDYISAKNRRESYSRSKQPECQCNCSREFESRAQ